MKKHEGLLFDIGCVVGKESIKYIPGNPGNTTRIGIPLAILEQTMRDLLIGYRHKTNDEDADLPPGAMIYIVDEPSIDAVKVEIFFKDYTGASDNS